MDKKGFTLIELLAVIVILAIIALIATPIVLNIIKDSRESAGLRSAEMYLDAVEQAVSIEKMNNTSFNPSTCTIKEDGNLTCEGTNVQVEVKGEKPLKGNIVFESGKITEVRLEYKNNKIILKNEKGNLEYFDYDRNSDINFIVEGIKEQKTTTGKNIYSGGNISGTQSVKKNIQLIPPGTYTISANIESSDTDASKTLIGLHNENGVYFKGLTISRGTRKSVTFTTEYTIAKLNFFASNSNDNSVGDIFSITDIQIEEGEVATEYEEYTGGKPSPSPEYPQDIPLIGTLNTKTGKYDINVTASTENGVKSKSLTLTSPVQLTKWDKLVKKDGLWGWSIWSREIDINMDKTINGNVFSNSGDQLLIVSTKNVEDGQVMCNIFRGRKVTFWGDLKLNEFTYVLERLRFHISPDIATTHEEVKDWLAQNPFKVQAKALEEQAFHPLPDEEQNLLYNLKL